MQTTHSEGFAHKHPPNTLHSFRIRWIVCVCKFLKWLWRSQISQFPFNNPPKRWLYVCHRYRRRRRRRLPEFMNVSRHPLAIHFHVPARSLHAITW